MKLTINTNQLQNMLNKAIKGVGANKLIPITSMIGIKGKGRTLKVISTDATNYLYITETIEVPDELDLSITVDADLLFKLVGKTTSPHISLEVQDKTLVVAGNGVYKLELPLDENGDPVDFPDPLDGVKINKAFTKIPLATVQEVIQSLKPSLAVNMSNPCYTKYYFGDIIIGTDTFMISELDKGVMKKTPRLLTREFLDLISLGSTDTSLSIGGDWLVASSDKGSILVCCKDSIDLEDFNIKGIEAMLKTEYPAWCEVNTQELLSVLDRLSLFVGLYDDDVITLTFTEDGLEITSVNDSGAELVEYREQNGDMGQEFRINLDQLLTQIKTYPEDIVRIYYGEDASIQLGYKGLIHVVALVTD